ncbi:YdeI/OmpD-associated family protein [Ornithinimicrobium humiphilum]|nr:YdeI/OmpD-associated family protein [Ornithinimicrobium humiphilum]
MTISFRSSARLVNGRCIVQLPEDASAALPSRGQVAVDAVIGGRPVATVLEPDGRKGHWISVAEDLQDGLGLTDGDPVAVDLEIRSTWPEPQLPDDLAEALAGAPDLADVWQDITPMARWEWVRWVGATRNLATRQRRVEVTLSKLRDGKRRPCCFDLASCTDPELSRSGKLVVG